MDFTILRKLSEQKKVSLKSLCLAAGITEAGLQNALKNNSIKAITLEKLAKAINEPVAIFFDGYKIPEKLPELSTFGARLKWVIDRANLSAYAYAAKININKATISRLINNEREPAFEILQKITSFSPDIDNKWLLLGNEGYYSGNTKNLISEPASAYNKSCPECQRHIETNINLNKLIQKLETELKDCGGRLPEYKKGKQAS